VADKMNALIETILSERDKNEWEINTRKKNIT
jgi:hypothetical protein